MEGPAAKKKTTSHLLLCSSPRVQHVPGIHPAGVPQDRPTPPLLPPCPRSRPPRDCSSVRPRIVGVRSWEGDGGGTRGDAVVLHGVPEARVRQRIPDRIPRPGGRSKRKRTGGEDYMFMFVQSATKQILLFDLRPAPFR